jgi:hypothetical protein
MTAENLLTAMHKDIAFNKRIINFYNTFKCTSPLSCMRCTLKNICDLPISKSQIQ